ncbi:MAG TPA: MlaD family protein [Pseudonocardia sp.]|nr:MlaD family protein [Pseudonocardia sp.]
MISRLIRVQLVVFVLVSILGVGAMLLVYVRLPEVLGVGVHHVTVDFAKNAGLYANAKVLYRGVEIGQVSAVRATPAGAEVELVVQDDTPLPADSTAAIRSVSAAGEQYVEFASPTGRAPYLPAGATVPVSRTALPTDIGPLLDQVQALLASVPKQDLTSVIDEAYRAFDGAGPDLGRLLDGTRDLVTEAQRNVDPTRTLIADAGPVLDTQLADSAQIRALTHDLNSFTAKVRERDPDLRSLLATGQPLAEQTDQLFQDLQPTVPILLDNLVSVGQVGVTYNPALRQVLVLYPLVVTTLQTITLPLTAEGSANLDFKATVNVPPPCTLGFLPISSRRDVEDVSVTRTPSNLYCKLPQNDPSVVRGARNAPCPDEPGKRGASVEQCDGRDFRALGGNSPFPPAGQTPPPGGSPAGGPPRPPAGLTGYDRASGGYLGPDGQLFVLGGVGTEHRSGEASWRNLLLDPLGH